MTTLGLSPWDRSHPPRLLYGGEGVNYPSYIDCGEYGVVMTRVLVALVKVTVGLALIVAGISAQTTPDVHVVRACPSELAAHPPTPSPCNRPATQSEQMQWQRDHLAWVIQQQMKATPTPVGSSTDSH